ncbi:putative Zinc finger, RING/FYVE/PHD-type [Helianthus debilis subsp. tardiflorus]
MNHIPLSVKERSLDDMFLMLQPKEQLQTPKNLESMAPEKTDKCMIYVLYALSRSTILFLSRKTKQAMVFYKCGHMCCCVTCSSHLTSCPLCRSRITQVVKTYRH